MCLCEKCMPLYKHTKATVNGRISHLHYSVSNLHRVLLNKNTSLRTGLTSEHNNVDHILLHHTQPNGCCFAFQNYGYHLIYV